MPENNNEQAKDVLVINGNQSRKKILVFGSALEKLKSIRNFLEGNGIETVCSDDLTMGEDLLYSDDYGLILVDFNMIEQDFEWWVEGIKRKTGNNPALKTLVFLEKKFEGKTGELLSCGFDRLIVDNGDENVFSKDIYDAVIELVTNPAEEDQLTVKDLEEDSGDGRGTNELMDEIARMSSKLEEALISETRLRKELEEVNRTKDELLSFAAHDLRSPLSTILSTVNFILDPNMDIGPLNKDQVRFIMSIRNQSQHLITLVNEFLDFSKIQSDFVDLNLSPTDIHALIIEKCSLYTIAASKKSISLGYEVEKNLPTISADENKIASVLDNLIGNAIKYCTNGDKVVVKANTKGNELLVEVEDTGQGLRKEEMGKVFGAFQKLSARPTGGEESTGLGLAIVKKIVEAHGGRVGVKSEFQKGSVFFFALKTG